MRKNIGTILCICLLMGAVSGCGSEDSNLIENNNTATFEESSESETINAAESETEQLDWKQAYLAKAEEIGTEEETLKYDLIYLDGDDIPELVAGPMGQGFYLYTWRDGEVHELVNCIDAKKVYCRYYPYQGIIAEDFSKIEIDYVAYYTEYYKVTENMDMVIQCRLFEQCKEEGSIYFYQGVSIVGEGSICLDPAVEITKKEFSSYTDTEGDDWLEICGRYDLETFCGLVETMGDLWEQEELLVLEGLDQKTLESLQYIDADGNNFYITEKNALQEAAALLGGLRGIPCTWEPDTWHRERHNYCTISFTTTDGKWDCVVYEGNNLHRTVGDSGFKMQDDFEEIITNLLYFTSTDYLLSLVESEEGRQTIQGILEEEGSQLARLDVNRLEDLNYCLFETSAGKGLEFHLFLWGSWKGKEVQQHQVFPLNEEEGFPLDELSERCEVTMEDIDFDGKPDLLIYEGNSGGSGGFWMHYRVMRWDEAQGQFAYYPSFPFWMTFWNLEDKQVIYKARAGVGDYTVRIYEVIDGEYQEIQGLHIDYWAEVFSYYENGELVWEGDVSGMDMDEMEEFFREEGLSEIFSYARDYG